MEKKFFQIINSFEAQLISLDIISDTLIEEKVHHIVAELKYNDGIVISVPLIWYEGEDFIFTPWDWQDCNPLEADAIEDIRWRVNDTEKEGVMLNGLPRLI